MARHAGFAAVASINEETANKILATYFVQVQGPYFVPLPQTVPVGADTVTFAGIIQMDTPTIELHPDPNDLVTTHFSFRTIMKAQVNNNPMRQWTIQFNVTAKTRLIAQVVNSRVVLGVNDP